MSYINRNNYETFFLLYTDNELSATEKKLVDEFVQLNPDLQEELLMLQQSVLKPDSIVFDNKAGLFMYEINPSPVQEKLLLLLDNELPVTEKKEIEKLIKTDAGIEKEWTILQQTKLLADKAIFKDKRSLYRKEEAGVINFAWWRVAAAAVFIGFGVWGGLVYFNNKANHRGNEIAKNIKLKTTPAPVKPATHEIAAPVDSTIVKEKETALVQEISKKPVAVTKQFPVKVAAPTLPASEIETIAVKEKTNNLPKPYFENVNKNGSNKTITAYVTPENQANNIVNPGNNELVKNAGKQDPANSYAAVTSYTDNSEDNNNRVLFMDEEKIKKTKLGGIFRKVKRVLERSTNIKPGGNNNIKVANLEFAIQ